MEKRLRSLAKHFRKKPTKTENYLWFSLKNRQLEGVKFRRQEPIGRFIADFVSYETKLIIEVDGSQHSPNKDRIRDKWFCSQGYEVLRFWDNEVLKNKGGVLEAIRQKLPPHPAPLPQGEMKYPNEKNIKK